MKVFDVVLNGDLTVNSDLDIFEKVGRGVAHDEYVEFSVENNKIIYQGEEQETRGEGNPTSATTETRCRHGPGVMSNRHRGTERNSLWCGAGAEE